METQNFPEPPNHLASQPDGQSTSRRRRTWIVRIVLTLVLLGLIGSVTFISFELRHLDSSGERLERSATRLDNRLVSLDTRLQSQRRVLASLQKQVENLATELTETTEKLPPDIPSLVSEVKDSVVTVHVGSGQGSGFAVDVVPPGGYQAGILTAAHVIDAATYVGGPRVFISQGGSRIPAKLWTWGFKADIALLYVDASFPPLPWASDVGHEPNVGDAVVAIGSPFGLEGTT